MNGKNFPLPQLLSCNACIYCHLLAVLDNECAVKLAIQLSCENVSSLVKQRLDRHGSQIVNRQVAEQERGGVTWSWRAYRCSLIFFDRLPSADGDAVAAGLPASSSSSASP